ncbi:MAG: class I tRNA ligase family protein [Aquificae bacterium]|nr:class I tRNA ligase family protein [Aquificota bacterium]
MAKDPQKVKESDLYRLYPTDLLVTGFDIIFFWVARMVLMGMYDMGAEPFKTVYVHGLIRDRFGNKMSKTKGNVVDPLDMIKKYGADALRFGLAVQTVPGSDIKFDESRIEGYKHFANKIWNASRFVVMNLPADFSLRDPSETALEPEDRWILYELNRTVKEVRAGLDAYDFARAARALYSFFWDQYCDWYIEFTKERVYKDGGPGREAALNTLVFVLDRALRLLHPFMPFLTEEIWDHLPTKDRKSISLAPYPKPEDRFEEFEEAAREVEFLKAVVSSVRNLKTNLDLPVTKRLRAYYRADSPKAALVERFRSQILRLARLESLEPASERPEGTLVLPLEGLEVFVSVEGEVNVPELRSRLLKRREKVSKELERSLKKLENPNFVQRAPKEVVERERKIAKELELELKKVEEVLRLLER